VEPSPTPATWDPETAIRAALKAAGDHRHVLAAELALRLAHLGHVTGVRFDIASGVPTEVLRSLLGEAISAAGPAQNRPGEAIGGRNGSGVEQGPAHALVSVREACAKRSGACVTCGKAFEVNSRHPGIHRFCSAACRSRYRRREHAG